MTAPDDGGAAAGPSPANPFAAIEALYDSETVRLLYARGIDDGWRCLEVGAGSGSIAKWLCKRAGTYGRVVVTDIDITPLEEIDEPNVEIHRHDIVDDPLPEGVFQLVHSRIVLADLVERDRALEKMVASLRSGGCIMIEELDRSTIGPDTESEADALLFSRVEVAVSELLRSKGLDPFYGRRIYRRLLTLGLSDPVSRGASVVQKGGTPAAELLGAELETVRSELIASTAVSPEDIDACAALLNDPAFVFMSPNLVTTWAWRPSPF